MLKFHKNGKWKDSWGGLPLPFGAVALGAVETDGGVGVLLQLSDGLYVQGVAGAIRQLSQRDVLAALDRSRHAAALGREGGKGVTEKKLVAIRANIKLSSGRRGTGKRNGGQAEVSDGSN